MGNEGTLKLAIGHPIHNAVPLLDGRLDMVLKVGECHVEPSFILVSLLIPRGKRFQDRDKAPNLIDGSQEFHKSDCPAEKSMA
jgi:hypothetical protein